MGPADPAELGRFIAIDPIARRLRRVADEVLGYPLLDRYDASGDDYSEPAVVAFLIACLALAEWAGERLGVRPDLCVGASFGQKSVAVYAGSLSFPEAVELAVGLTRCEADYFGREHRDVVTVSIARTPGEVLGEILAGMDACGEWHEVSCLIDHDLHMITLAEPSLAEFSRQVRAAGGFPLYTMRPPMHSTAFGELRGMAEEVVGDLTFTEPALPVVSDQDGSLVTTADGMRSMILDYFVRPVNWPAAVRTLIDRGVTTMCVAGPDSLFGRVNCTVQNFDVLAVNPRMALRPRTTWANQMREGSAIHVG